MSGIGRRNRTCTERVSRERRLSAAQSFASEDELCRKFNIKQCSVILRRYRESQRPKTSPASSSSKYSGPNSSSVGSERNSQRKVKAKGLCERTLSSKAEFMEQTFALCERHSRYDRHDIVNMCRSYNIQPHRFLQKMRDRCIHLEKRAKMRDEFSDENFRVYSAISFTFMDLENEKFLNEIQSKKNKSRDAKRKRRRERNDRGLTRRSMTDKWEPSEGVERVADSDVTDSSTVSCRHGERSRVTDIPDFDVTDNARGKRKRRRERNDRGVTRWSTTDEREPSEEVERVADSDVADSDVSCRHGDRRATDIPDFDVTDKRKRRRRERNDRGLTRLSTTDEREPSEEVERVANSDVTDSDVSCRHGDRSGATDIPDSDVTDSARGKRVKELEVLLPGEAKAHPESDAANEVPKGGFSDSGAETGLAEEESDSGLDGSGKENEAMAEDKNCDSGSEVAEGYEDGTKDPLENNALEDLGINVKMEFSKTLVHVEGRPNCDVTEREWSSPGNPPNEGMTGNADFSKCVTQVTEKVEFMFFDFHACAQVRDGNFNLETPESLEGE